MTLIIVGLALMLAAAVWRDLQRANQRSERDAWAEQWHSISAAGHALRGLGQPEVIARMIGDPTTPREMLDVLATDLAANDWIPSDRLLDQLRRWASSQIVAESALTERRRSKGATDTSPNTSPKTHPPSSP